jgi:hypothetical protein
VDIEMMKTLRNLLLGVVVGLASSSILAASLDEIDVNGYFSFEYEETLDGNGGDENGSFDLDLFDLVLNFNLSNQLRVATDITWEHGTATEDDRGNAAVEYAFAEYTINDLVKFRAGKMFTHFGIYNEIHTAKPATLTVKEPLSTNKNNKLGSEFRFYPRWNTGLALLGEGELAEKEIDYILQISNGDDDELNPYEEDANTSKALNGRLRLQYNDDLNLGASFYHDSQNHYDGNGDVDGKTVISSAGGQLEYEAANGVGFELEGVAGRVKDFQDQNIYRYAASAMIYRHVSNFFTPYYRFEYLDPNKNISNDEGLLHIIGVNLTVDKNMYIKLEVDKLESESANAKYSGEDFIEFKSSISIGF